MATFVINFSILTSIVEVHVGIIINNNTSLNSLLVLVLFASLTIFPSMKNSSTRSNLLLRLVIDCAGTSAIPFDAVVTPINGSNSIAVIIIIVESNVS